MVESAEPDDEPGTGSTGTPGVSWREGLPVLVGVGVLTVVLAVAWWGVDTLGLHANPAAYQIYYVFFHEHEPEAWAQMLGGLLLLALLLRLGRTGERATRLLASGAAGRRVVWAAAGFVLVVGTVLSATVHHQHAFSMDEFAAVYQSEIFASGSLSAHVPSEWQPYGRALTPVFVSYKVASQIWHQSYLPMYAALRSVFVLLGAPLAFNSLLGAVSVVAAAGVARKLWPEDTAAPVVVAVLLASSCQVLFTSASSYAMPAYLALHMVWLWLYLTNERWSLALAPVVGAVALGVHQIVVHALFVAPFCLRVVLRRRWALATYFVAVYGAAIAGWLAWYHFAHQMPEAEASSKVLSQTANTFFQLAPPSYQWLNQGINLVLLFNWQSLAFVVCLLIAATQWRRFDDVAVDLALGVGVTCALYVFYLGNQGHGWGYRYIYGVLGNFVLLSIWGWKRLVTLVGRGGAGTLLAASTAFAVAMQVPIRAMQVDANVRPFAELQEYFARQPERMLVLHSGIVWYGEDMVRNDPFLENPTLILRMQDLPADASRRLPALGKVRLVTPAELEERGFPLTPMGRGAPR